MPRRKRFIENDVLTEAKARIHHIFDTHDSVVVGFSGGKDSLAVLHLVKEVQEERGITGPVNALFYDEELLPDAVIDFVNHYRQLPWVNLVWTTLPMKSEKYILGEVKDYVQWDPNRQHVRPMPEWGVREADLGLPVGKPVSQYDMGKIVAGLFKGRVASLTGLRAAESLTRLQSVMVKLNECYICDSGHPRVSLCKPIYDWQENDVFRYFYDHGIRYCPVYDAELYGRMELRVATPLRAEGSKRLGKWREVAPTLYAQIIDIFPEMLVQERYYSEFDRTSEIERYMAMGWDGPRRWVESHLTDPKQRALALKRLEAVDQMRQRRPDGWPLRHVLRSLQAGNFKRQIMPKKDEEGRVWRERDGI